jgi:hypothetical protein
MSGMGAPRHAPQIPLFDQIVTLVKTNRFYFASNSDLMMYFDNKQSQRTTTSATSQATPLKVAVVTHMMGFHLLLRGPIRVLVQQRFDCM